MCGGAGGGKTEGEGKPLNETSYLNITKLAESMIGSTVLLILVASGRWWIAWLVPKAS